MAIIDFPSNPTNGQTYNQNGVSYYYNAAIGAWLTQITSTELSSTAANNQVLFVDGGISNGTSGLVYTKAANTLFANGVVANTMVTDRLHVSSISGVGLNPTNNAIVAAFDRANNSLQNTSFTLNGDLTVSGTVNTNININATRLRSNIIQSSTGTNFIIDGYPRMPGQIIEYLSSPCDGSTIVGASGSYTWPSVTAQQSDSYSYIDLNGSSISYTPPAGATRVIYRFEWQSYWGSAHAIAHNKFFIDGTEVLYARHSRSSQYHEGRSPFEWTINIGGVGNTNTGRQASWTTAKIMKIQYRSYGSGDIMYQHGTTYWDGGGGNQFSMPHLSIIAIA